MRPHVTPRATQEYSYSSDMWSLGLSIMTVALGRFPLDTRGGYWGLLHSLRENDAPTLPEDSFSPTIVDFIRRMMDKVISCHDNG